MDVNAGASGEVETPEPPPHRCCKANEVFCALFFKKALLA
jgi:hypothetical protein